MNKLTKLLSVFIIAGAVGVTAGGIVGCKKSGHTHKVGEGSYVNNHDGTHDGYCKDHSDVLLIDNEDHVFEDGVCVKCGGAENEEPATVTGVTVTAEGNATTVAEQGGTLQLSASVTTTGVATDGVTWSSSDETKATVSESGLVTAGNVTGTVTITATSTWDDTKTGEIQLTVTALGTYERLCRQSNKLYNNDFTAAFTAPMFSGTYGGDCGVYSSIEGGASVDTQTGKLVQKSGETANFDTVVDFGTIAANSVVEGYFEVSVTAKGSAWNIIQFRSLGGSTVLAIGAAADAANLSYVVGSGLTEKAADGKTNVNVAGVVDTGVAFAENTDYKVYYKFDLQTGKVELDINGTAIKIDDANIKDVNGIRFASGNSGKRLVTLDNIVFCGAEMTLSDYIAAAKPKLTAEYEKYTKAEEGYDYETNGADLDKAYSDGNDALDAADTLEKAQKAYSDAVAAMKAVLSDTALTAARTQARTSLRAKFPTANYTINLDDGKLDSVYNNKAKYDEEIAALEAQINAAKTQAALDAIVDGATLTIGNDAAQIAAKQQTNDVAEYRQGEIESIDAAQQTHIDNIAKIKSDVAGLITAKLAEDITAGAKIEGITEIIATAKSQIDSEILATQETPADTRNRLKSELQTAGNNLRDSETNAERKAAINTAVEKGQQAIDAADDDKIQSTYNAQLELVKAAAPKCEKKVGLLAYYETQQGKIKGSGTAVDTAKTALSTAYTDGVAAIENAPDVASVTEVYTAARAALKKVVDDLYEIVLTVTLGTTGETNAVKYGTELKLGDIYVTAYTVTAASYNSTPITADTGVKVYGDITIDVTTAEIDGFFPEYETTWSPTAGSSDYENILDDCLLKVSSTGGASTTEKDFATYRTGTRTIGGKTFTVWWSSANINAPKDKEGGTNEVHDNSATPLVIKAKHTLQTFTLYLSLADSAGTGTNRYGTIYAVINGGTPIAIKTLTANGDMSVAWTPDAQIKAGDVIEIYADNQSGNNGARVHLYGIDAAIDETRVAKTVQVTWQGDSDSVVSTYHYYDLITVPENLPEITGVVTGWTYSGGEWSKTLKLPGGSNVTMTPVTAQSNVTINYVVYETTKPETFYVAEGKTGIEWKVADPEPNDTDKAAGKMFLGWYASATPAETDEPFDFTAVAPDTTATIYAVFATPAIKELKFDSATITSNSVSDADGLITISKASSGGENLSLKDRSVTISTGNSITKYLQGKAMDFKAGSKAVSLKVYCALSNSGGTSKQNGTISATGKDDTTYSNSNDYVIIELSIAANGTATITPSGSNRLNVLYVEITPQ